MSLGHRNPKRSVLQSSIRYSILSFTGPNSGCILSLQIHILVVVSSKKGCKMSLRYKENPFIGEMVVPVKGKQVTLSRMGKDENVLVNQDTGEVQGTSVVTYKKVDSEQFVKLFTANIALTFGLCAAGIKAFNVLMWCVQSKAITKDQVDLDSFSLDEFLEAHSNNEPPIKLSSATFKRGLADLENSQIIAKTIRKGRYYINPNFCFNGDRIAFTTLIERDPVPKEKPAKQGDEHLQQQMDV